MNLKYSVDSKSKKKYFYKPLLIIISIDILAFLFFLYVKKMTTEESILVLLGILAFSLILYIAPLFAFYFNYFFTNKNCQLVITANSLGNIFSYKSGTINIEIKESDIKQVVFYLPPPVYEKRAHWLFWDKYFYSKIILENQEIVVTCLLCDDFNKYIPQNKKVLKKVPFPFVKSKD